MHARIVAADAAAEVGHRLVQITAVLAGEPRLGAVADESLLMATGANDGSIGALRQYRLVRRRVRLLQVGPCFFGEILRQRHQIVALKLLHDGRHLIVLASAGFEIPQLEEKVA